MRASMLPGPFTLRILSEFKIHGLTYVYLRHYENLPESVGNDVDILVGPRQRWHAVDLIRAAAAECGWRILKVVAFSPLSVFLARYDGEEFLHIDLFDRLEWHWVEYADAAAILSRRQYNGQVFHPAAGDELFLNVCTRLIYTGLIRKKHRTQAREWVEREGATAIQEAFEFHLAAGGARSFGQAVAECDWKRVEARAWTLRGLAIFRYAMLRPWRGLCGLARLIRRSAGRLLRPPGLFIVFIGTEGRTTDAIVRAITPVLQAITGRTDTLVFHWKPCWTSGRKTPSKSANLDAQYRGKGNRAAAGIIRLAFEWLALWCGWFRFILPARARNRPVIAMCHVNDHIPESARYRLSLPSKILRFAARTAPQPELVFVLRAIENLSPYHNLEPFCFSGQSFEHFLLRPANGNPRVVLINAEEPIASVVRAIRNAIVSRILSV